jgi:hypothetical protein
MFSVLDSIRASQSICARQWGSLALNPFYANQVANRLD